MLFLKITGWLAFSCVLMSFVEHQVHSRLMHRRSIDRFKRTFEAHAIVHHGQHYAKSFVDKPVPPGEDREIRLTVWKAPIKAFPFALPIALVSPLGAGIFLSVVTAHHWIWNKIHLEMHKPELRGFSNWPGYKFLARCHWLHHRYPNKNFNVVFPVADYILGTHAQPNEAEQDEMRQLGLLSEKAAKAPSPTVMNRH